MSIRVPNAAETELSLKVAELLWDRRNRPLTVGDLVQLLYPDEAKGDQRRKKVERAARIAANDMDWIVGEFADGTLWFASPSVAKTMTAPAPEPVSMPPPRPLKVRRSQPGDDPVANRLRRALELAKGDSLTVEELTASAFRAMAVHRAARDGVRATAMAVAAELGWKLVEDHPAGPTYVRTPVDDNKPSFEEVA